METKPSQLAELFNLIVKMEYGREAYLDLLWNQMPISQKLHWMNLIIKEMGR